MEQVKDFKTLVAEYERGLIEEALAASAGHQRRAAASLGILPTTLHEKMKRLGLSSVLGVGSRRFNAEHTEDAAVS